MELTHFDENGKARMVDVTDKQDTVREATAAGKITVSRTDHREPDSIRCDRGGKGRKRRCSVCCDDCRHYGGEADGGSDSDVPYPSDH